MIPFLSILDRAERVLIAGCGGGFDVFSGIPIATYLARRGASVTFANLSFTSLAICGGEKISANCWRIHADSNELPYFPELRLVRWLAARSRPAPVYAFAKTGVKPLIDAYARVLALHPSDLVVLVDGGTDSVIFGDEPGLGTPVEDAVSLRAAVQAHSGQTVLACLGFGVDHYHGVSHHAFLENVAELVRDGHYLGSFSVTKETPEGADFLAVVDFVNARQPGLQSIVCNSIASALRGEFGDFHATSRTKGEELFINPLMTQYWTFDAAAVVDRMRYGAALNETDSYGQAERVIANFRDPSDVRPRKPIPL